MSTKAGVSGDQHGEALPISSSNKPVLRASPPILQRHTGPNDLFVAPYDQARALSFDSEHKLRSENIPFDIDVWYVEPQLEIPDVSTNPICPRCENTIAVHCCSELQHL